MVIGFYQEPWKPLPDHMINGVCDAPGWTNTAYGPLPGQPRLHASVRRFLIAIQIDTEARAPYVVYNVHVA